MISVYAPATSANLNVGFDVLGVAVAPIDGTLLGDRITVDFADEFHLINQGRYADRLPEKVEDNIVYQCWDYFCQKMTKPILVTLTLEKNMPIGSGLGSSACSVVATFFALNELCGRPFNQHELLLMMGELEGRISGSIHYDNVAPCYLGGMQLILEENNIISQSIPHFEKWYWILAYPGITVSTAKARAILPTQYLKQECVDHSRHLAGFIHASYTKQSTLAGILMRDIIAEPYRKKLLPHFSSAKEMIEKMGGIACGISGSGPTLFAITEEFAHAQKIAGWLKENYLQNKDGFIHICRVDTTGTRKLDQ